MRYMGSKNKYSKILVPIIQKYIDENNIENFISCFCGGANLEDKIQCKNVIARSLTDFNCFTQTSSRRFL